MRIKRIGEKTIAEWKRNFNLYLEDGTWLQKGNCTEQQEAEI